MIKTPWFSKEIKPVHPGCYEVDFGQQNYQHETPEFQYWDGEDWWYGCSNPSNRTEFTVPNDCHRDWCGLTTKQGK